MSWFFSKGNKYSPLPQDELVGIPSDYAKSAFNFDSAFEYEQRGGAKNFRSVFKFDKNRNNLESDYYKYLEGEQSQQSPSPLIILSYFLTSASYLMFILGFPVLYWFCVIKLGESDRLVVFRLGKMMGVKGPGRVVIFPWLDNYKRIDVRASAFSVPPQQFISADGGIIEMGADIQFGIVDVETMVREVADHQDILRSLGRSLMTKVLTKKTVSQLTKDRRMAAEDILNLLNNQVRKWGLDVRLVTLSDPKVLKKPEGKSSLNPILQNLGLKQEKQFPSPQQFIQSQFYGEGEEQDPNAEALNTLASAVGGMFTGDGPPINLGNMNPPMKSAIPMTPANTSYQPQVNNFNNQTVNRDTFWKGYLENIVNQDSLQLEPEAMGTYQITITRTPAGQESFIIDISPGCNRVFKSRDANHLKPQVQITLDSDDLLAVLQGSLSPLQAYLTGRISATGDVKKLRFFDKISSRGHKQGSMFSI